MVRGITQPNVFELTRLVTRHETAGKLSLPVDSAVLLYSRFKYVRGMPSAATPGGLPLSKLRALDNLIDRLIRLRGKQPIVKNVDDLATEEIDGLIQQYRRGVHRAITADPHVLNVENSYDVIGLTFNIVA